MNPLETTSVAWHFPMLIVTVSLVYSATRFENWKQILHEAISWGLRMTLFLAGIGIGLHFLSALDWVGMWIAIGCILVGWVAYSLLSRPRENRG